MATMLRISEAASLAMHAMALLARDPERVRSTRAMAEELGASEAHLTKVLQRLTRAELVQPIRGARGGFLPSKPVGNVSMLEIYEGIEGPIPDTTCLLGKAVCEGHPCILGDLMSTVNREVKHHLTQTRLADLAKPRKKKKR